MEKEEISQIVAEAVGSAMALVIPVIETLADKIQDLEANKSKTVDEASGNDAKISDAIKLFAKTNQGS